MGIQIRRSSLPVTMDNSPASLSPAASVSSVRCSSEGLVGWYNGKNGVVIKELKAMRPRRGPGLTPPHRQVHKPDVSSGSARSPCVMTSTLW